MPTAEHAAETAPRTPDTASAATVTTTRTGDLLRALLCAALVGACVESPGSAPVLAPFVPALVAIRLLRRRGGSRAFLVTATLASLVLALVGSAGGDALEYAVAMLAALALVPGLGLVHQAAALRDPATTDETAWPEPRLRSGFSLTIVGWGLALLVLAAVALPFAPPPRDLAVDAVREAYAPYTRECDEGGALVDREGFCEEILAQRDDVRDAARVRGPELVATVLALVAFGGAATAHLVTLARARRARDTIRPRWRLRDLEVHWSAAYLVAAGIAAWLLATGDEPVIVAVRALGVGVGALGALLVVAQGLGLVAWMFTRGRSPRWYRAFLLLISLFVLPVVTVLLFGMGVLDMGLRPRRRALKSGNLPGRGSGG